MRMHINRINLRIFLIVFSILSIIIIPFIIFISYQFAEYSKEEINNFNQDKSHQVARNMDFFLNYLKTYGLNIYEDMNIQSWMLSAKEDIILQKAAENSIRKYLSSQPFINNCYIINMRTQTIVDSLNPNGNFSNFHDQDILKYLYNEQGAYLRYFDHISNGKSYLALVLPSTPARRDYYGYVVLLIDKNLLSSFYMSGSESEGREMFVVDSNGNMLLSTSGITEKPNIESFGENMDNPIGYTTLTYDDTKWSANYATLELQNWTLYSMNRLDKLSQNINYFRNKMILYVSLFYLLLLVVTFWNYSRAYKPLIGLSTQIQKRIGKHSSKSYKSFPFLNNDFSMLQKDIQLFLNNTDKISESIRIHHDLIRDEHIRQWILQGKMDKAVKEFIDEESKLSKYSKLYLVVIRLEAYQSFCEKNDFSTRKLLKFAMCNISNELLENEGWGSECIDLGGNHIVLLIGRDGEINQHYLDVIKNISAQILKYLEIPTSSASSVYLDTSADLRTAYDDTLELTMLKFINGEDKVYLQDDYEEFSKMQQPIPDEDTLNNIIEVVRLGKTDKIKPLIEKMLQHMKNLSYESCKLQLTYIIYTISKSFSQIAALKENDSIKLSIDRFNTLQEFYNWLEDLLIYFANNINTSTVSKRKEEIAAEIVEYVKNHLHDPMLTQEEIATHLSLSYSYIRGIFKEVFNTTLSDYILSERINTVKNLLRTTQLSVTQIAEHSGFQSKSNFFTVFKKYTGVTPNEYRMNEEEK